MDDFHFAMVSEWMMNGNINEFIEANGEANRFELVGHPSRCSALDANNPFIIAQRCY